RFRLEGQFVRVCSREFRLQLCSRSYATQVPSSPATAGLSRAENLFAISSTAHSSMPLGPRSTAMSIHLALRSKAKTVTPNHAGTRAGYRLPEFEGETPCKRKR